jgi:alpha-L-rhamnosidase/Glycosyl hydrolases family 2, sugar binding domain
LKRHCYTYLLIVLLSTSTEAQVVLYKDPVEKAFYQPNAAAKPWVFWYWLHGAVSKEGITADLEAMKEVGIGGAYLMPIKDTNSAIPFQPQVRQLSPAFWQLVKFALQEAKRLKLEIGVHYSDGFALGGGPWIKPEMSMQKLSWSKVLVTSADQSPLVLPMPAIKENYYKDIAVYAYPANYNNEIIARGFRPDIITSNGTDASFLYQRDAKQTFRADSNCWIQYSYPAAVTIRQVEIKKQNNAYQSQRFIIQQSDDGIHFTAVDTLLPPRHGWQDWDEPYTHAVKKFTAKHIRFVWQKEGTEPGSEDLDAAKWKTALRVQGIYISDEPVISHYQGKNGSIWRLAPATTTNEVSREDAVPLKNIINLTSKLDKEGRLHWTTPDNRDWVIVRIGHTSTGYTNATGGGGKGLECDKFSTAAATLQFNNWFGKFFSETDPVLARQVIKVFHLDSWECGSQNWSSNFASEFKIRRGYDLLPYLLVMTGVPVQDIAQSEKILYDVRQTIAELVNDQFYATLAKLAKTKGCRFSAESIAPTFMSDGLMQYQYADMPMGEFWVNSPTHDKPNDMLDAISGAHIYGKNIVQAEAFTTLRSDWSEHPGNLKVLGDRAFTSGINKLALHVFMHNPWPDKKPGITLDGIGLFYQRNQTWFKQSKAWIDYLSRCHRLLSTLPGLFGKDKVAAEKKRMENLGQPQRELPAGVSHSANMADPENYIDPLRGYSYDCFNPDVLMKMTVKNGRAITPGGASYKILVVPGIHQMNPDGKLSEAVRTKIKELAAAGVKIIIGAEIKGMADGKQILQGPFTNNHLYDEGLSSDMLIQKPIHPISWTHRRLGETDIYFLTNNSAAFFASIFSFAAVNKEFELWDPVSGHREILQRIPEYLYKSSAVIRFLPYQSFFVIFRTDAKSFLLGKKADKPEELIDQLADWDISWKGNDGNIKHFLTVKLLDWSMFPDTSLKYYSGHMWYKSHFTVNAIDKNKKYWINIDTLHDLATVRINGKEAGILWTAPYQLDISKYLKPGKNKVEILVTNTWRNRLIGDELNPAARSTWFNSPYPLKNKPLLPAGITGEVKIVIR